MKNKKEDKDLKTVLIISFSYFACFLIPAITNCIQ
jgi:hypothetical protein